MRLGVSFWSGIDPLRLERTVERVETIGVRGLGHIAVKNWTDADIERARDVFANHGLFVGEVTLYDCGWPLASPEAAVRDRTVAELVKGCEHAITLKAHCVGMSVIANGPADGYVWSDEVWKRLVAGTSAAAAEAERVGVDLGFHPGNRGPIDTPEQLRRIIDDVGSPRVKVILDPVNMTNHRNYYSNGDFLNHTFDLLGDDIVAAHAKDVLLDDRHLITKLDEVPLGMGGIDYDTYVERLGQLDPDLLFTIEHYRDVGVCGTVASPVYVDYPEGDRENTRAREFIHDVARRVSVEFS